ncbi:threonine--tRNA ligase 2, cytoplasmic isoform X5 [Pteropus medius]|uniref:threonine--tRNA ligase 2, cytoplasmic isoform X5 n=1 Tax=Pteropus vampyrus TaxID=132908 RepID=UPI00196AC3DF|nr:threonine--tRNA ligase 2, cytoplasmic isoform X5 [Pteropus giganteus]
MTAEALAAEAVASRLERQEEDVRWLWAEVQRLRDEQLSAPERCPAEGPCLPREVAQLRAENRDLRFRRHRLRQSLAEGLRRQATLARAAQEEAGRAAAGAQVTGRRDSPRERSRAPPRARAAPRPPPALGAASPAEGQPPSIQNQEKDIKKEEEREPDSRVKNQPNFIKERLKLFEMLKKDHQLSFATYEKKGDVGGAITVRVAGGEAVAGEVWITTPYHVAAGLSRELAESTVIAKVNGELWDLDRPLEGDCTLELLTFDDEEAQAVYWHSSAHILGEAMELYYGGHLCCGPPIENGFYYDMFMEGRAVSSTELSALENLCQTIMSEEQPFERLEASKEVLLDMFKYNKFKCRILNEKVDAPATTVYRCGPLVDLCKGPHVRHTGKIKTIKIFKEEDRRHDFAEVVSPNVYSGQLWEVAGHRQHYSERTFTFDVDKDTFALKPMNCPGHCLMFAHRPRSWREMPVRFADFGVLHRNEPSGTLRGLTRVRRFQQDDAHVFCTVAQIEEEIKGCLQVLQSVYATFGFSFQLNLSTRPEHFLGDVETWDEAEKQLQNSLMEFGKPWKMNPGEGAFYGPKIDVKVKDAVGRYHQCATIQLDFQLPLRFHLTYASKDGDDKKNLVIIHRAILGSVERMIAILSENYGGKWPFWLSPRQVMVIPVGPTCEKYALQVSGAFFEEGFTADVDLDHSCTLNKKIRNAQLAQYNFILVVGEKEKSNNAVNVRTRDNRIHGEISVTSAIDKLKNLKLSRTLNAEEEF